MLTLVCFAGPFALLIIGGGSSAEWPPDRPVEWIVIVLVGATAAALFVACVTIGWWYPWPHRVKGRSDR
jgi:hypothetical protein